MATRSKATVYRYKKVTLTATYTLYSDDANQAVTQAIQKLQGDVRAGRAALNFKVEEVKQT